MESPEAINLGKSLPVPSVQELAKEVAGGTVPRRYLRPDLEPPARDAGRFPPIPVVDMERLIGGDSMAVELEKLHEAAKDWGFFQLVNHGISTRVVDNMKQEMQRFFQLPLEEKLKFTQLPGDIQGYGQAFVVSEEQKLEWADILSFFTLPTHQRKHHIFQNLSPSFREAIEAYAEQVQKLSMSLLELLAGALGVQPPEEMMGLFEDGLQAMRMSYYPPCPRPEEVIGVSPHSDAVALTVLLQVNEVQGLEIRKDGAWVPVKPLPGAFVVNIGDLLEIISNGTYPSIEHRVTLNPAQERLSISAFHYPNVTAEIGPAASLVAPKKPAVFRRVVVEDYLKALFSGQLRGKKLINSFRV